MKELHYIMNKDTPVIEIETARILNESMMPISLRVKTLDTNTVTKWIIQRALQTSRKNADKIYKAAGFKQTNQEVELMYLTHSLSINDNYWIANEKELGNLRYENISLFRNSLNKAMYMVALRGDDGFTLTDNKLSAEYTGQGTFPKCFIRETDGIYLYKSGNRQDIANEIYACYIAEILGAKTVHYDYSKIEGIECTKSKIWTNESINWETAFILSEFMNDYKYTPQQYAEQYLTKEYTEMIILDAIILNDDRHMKNWSFEIEADTNKIIGLAPNYDYNNAFRATSKTMSNLLFNNNKKMNVLNAGREAYRRYGTTLRLKELVSVLNNTNLPINKEAIKNRVLYITGQKDTPTDCY